MYKYYVPVFFSFAGVMDILLIQTPEPFKTDEDSMQEEIEKTVRRYYEYHLDINDAYQEIARKHGGTVDVIVCDERYALID